MIAKNMKKLISVVLSALLLLWSCGAEDKTNIEQLNSAINAHNSQKKFSGNYLLDITFGNESAGQYGTLYYAAGDMEWDRDAKKAYAKFNQNYLGTAYIMENYFSNGTMISVEDGKAIESERNADDLFSMFPYYSLLTYDESLCKNIAKGNNVAGTSYTFERSDTKAIFDKIFGDGIYDIIVSTTTMTSPQKDKTKYSNAKCVYTVSEGKLFSCRYEFDMTIYDTPAYIPGYTQEESKYTLELHIVAKVEFDSKGEIVIDDYSGAVSDMSSDISSAVAE